MAMAKQSVMASLLGELQQIDAEIQARSATLPKVEEAQIHPALVPPPMDAGVEEVRAYAAEAISQIEGAIVALGKWHKALSVFARQESEIDDEVPFEEPV